MSEGSRRQADVLAPFDRSFLMAGAPVGGPAADGRDHQRGPVARTAAALLAGQHEIAHVGAAPGRELGQGGAEMVVESTGLGRRQ